MRIQRRRVALVPGSSRPIVGSEMRTMFESIADMRVAIVVFERTSHLYCIPTRPPKSAGLPAFRGTRVAHPPSGWTTDARRAFLGQGLEQVNRAGSRTTGTRRS